MSERDPLNQELDDLRAEVERLEGIVTQLQENIDALWDGRFVEGMEAAAKITDNFFQTEQDPDAIVATVRIGIAIRDAIKEKARDGSTQTAQN